MRISAEKLTVEAEATGFRPDVLEKVAHLLGLLDVIQRHPFLKGKLVLKGGTALNLFIFDVPRLSVDIDLNYVGSEDRAGMLAERPRIEQAAQAVFSREGFTIRRTPVEHAGGTWALRYENASGRTGNLEVDINFMHRVPLWPVTSMDSHQVGTWRASGIPVLDRHELAAGKLAALFARRQPRDLFDSHRILRMDDLDHRRLRTGFVVHGAMNRRDWRTISLDDVDFDGAAVARQLGPLLRVTAATRQTESVEIWARLVRECRAGLSALFPLTDSERAFLDLLLDRGHIDAAILTDDEQLQRRIHDQPLLQWKALNVKRHKGLP